MRTVQDELITTGTNQLVPLWITRLFEDGECMEQFGPWVMVPPEEIRDFGKEGK
jgi:hypothetical protein